MADIITRLYQVMAVFLLPFIILIGLPVITVIHSILLQVLGPLGGTAWGNVFSWLATLASAGLFLGLIWFCYEFVKRGGWGLFDDKD